MSHEVVEKNIGLMAILIIVVISVAGLVQILPLFFIKETTAAVEGIKPYGPLELAGRDIYIRESCNACHSQMIRPFRAETERYGHYSVAGEFVYDHPHLWSSKRTGPDLHRVGGRYSDEWHRVHLINPRSVVPTSNMPGYPWLEKNTLDPESIQPKMRAMQTLNKSYGLATYTEEEIVNAPKALEGKTEMDAMIAYLQGLGTAIKSAR